MTKSTEQDKVLYRHKVKSFLREFGIPDTREISNKEHGFLMKTHFYWVCQEKNLGYYINEDIESIFRELEPEEWLLYQDLYYDKVSE